MYDSRVHFLHGYCLKLIMGGIIREYENKIVAYLERIEEKRREIFEPYPYDERNLISAKTMENFIQYIESLPNDNIILKRMEKYQSDDVYIPSGESEFELYKFMFSNPVEDFHSILSLIAELDFKEWFKLQNTYYSERCCKI
ncbi:MAG: hypothetical protein A4E53_02921 [Pelotomaculum sp. PtaB.Bin104]|nr:MAG: hypothetical protein A4E53_02921 [Pelotomaculum sp. PtaB.Bin104]